MQVKVLYKGFCLSVYAKNVFGAMVNLPCVA